jgi:hypothetical protein
VLQSTYFSALSHAANCNPYLTLPAAQMLNTINCVVDVYLNRAIHVHLIPPSYHRKAICSS